MNKTFDRFRRRLRRLGVVMCLPWIAFALSGAAQETTPDLRGLKTQLRKELITALLPEMKAHQAELLVLEKKCAAAQDFAGAVRVRDERVKLEQEIAALNKELPLLKGGAPLASSGNVVERIELTLADAALTALQLDDQDNALTGFGDPAASASWKLPGLPPGGYEVILRCTGGVGSAMLKESFHSLTAPLKASADKPVAQTLGTLRIRDGNGMLTLTASPAEKSASLRVYSIELVPSAR